MHWTVTKLKFQLTWQKRREKHATAKFQWNALFFFFNQVISVRPFMGLYFKERKTENLVNFLKVKSKPLETEIYWAEKLLFCLLKNI